MENAWLRYHVPRHALNRAARYFNYVLAAVILANCTAVALETIESIYLPNRALFRTLEAF